MACPSKSYGQNERNGARMPLLKSSRNRFSEANGVFAVTLSVVTIKADSRLSDERDC
jgi:hypothetical protein